MSISTNISKNSCVSNSSSSAKSTTKSTTSGSTGMAISTDISRITMGGSWFDSWAPPRKPVKVLLRKSRNP